MAEHKEVISRLCKRARFRKFKFFKIKGAYDAWIIRSSTANTPWKLSKYGS